MTAEHLRLVLESVPDTAAFHRTAQDLAQAEVPPDVLALLRLGRLTAFQKPGGGVRGIVCGDLVRRLVARNIAQQISSAVEEATSPFQCALTTKAGGERVAHAIQSLTDQNSRATVLSIDGISAFNMISRAAMLDGLQQVRGGRHCASFCAPVLLRSLPVSLDRHLFAYLDDMYVVCLPDRVAPSSNISRRHWSSTPASKFIWGRRRFGIVEVIFHLLAWRCKQPRIAHLARCWTSVTATGPCAGHPNWPRGVCAGRTSGH